MKSWLRQLLKIIPIGTLIDYIMEWLAEEAAKTETEVDDIAVNAVRVIFNAALNPKK